MGKMDDILKEYPYTDEQLAQASELIKDLMAQHGIHTIKDLATYLDIYPNLAAALTRTVPQQLKPAVLFKLRQKLGLDLNEYADRLGFSPEK